VTKISMEAKRFVQEMAHLAEVTEEVRSVLLRYTKISRQLVRRVNEGEPLVEALESLHGPLRRREVTEATQELEAARHRVRLAMFALGKAEGATASELGRQLGFSRQLASRLSNEADETFG